jgi:Tfp pilus assembly ATPase PilU
MFMGEQYGMQTVEQSLVGLVKNGLISIEEAFVRAPDTTTLEKLMQLEKIILPAGLRSSAGVTGNVKNSS